MAKFAKLAPEAQAFYSRLGTFRPSDRAVLERSFQTPEGKELVEAAVIAFVEQWDRSDWIEEYSIERIGKWLALKAPADVAANLSRWANKWSPARAKGKSALARGMGHPATVPSEPA